MDETPFYKRAIFWFSFWIVILVGIYLYQILTQQTIFSVLAVLLGAGLTWGLFWLWIAFYAQFILPVRSLEDRSRIIERLRRYMSRSHGPALFIQNGRIVAKEGELDRRRAGVIWIDTASAAVTRTTTAYKQVLGPGVHFTDDGEYLAGWLDLHPQVQTLGPIEGDLPFQKLAEDADEAARNKYRQVQERRTAVSALTRDGIEVVPNISVVFKIDAEPAAGQAPGSRFGYDEDSVFKAISKEGINPTAKMDARRVAWNQIPALIAADLWREYASKFTLNQFFELSQPPLPEIQQPEAPTPFKMPPPLPPSRVSSVTRTMRIINRSLEKRLQAEESADPAEPRDSGRAGPDDSPFPMRADARPKTALQIITQMIKARMTQTLVPTLDESGRIQDQNAVSEEYKKIQERGLQIISISVNNPRLPPSIEERAIQEWNGSWLINAKAEGKRLERRTAYVVDEAKQKALLDYTLDLSRSLVRGNPTDLDAMLLTLVERSRNEIIRDDRLRNQIAGESARSKEKTQPMDITPALLALINQSGKEAPKEPPRDKAENRTNTYLETLEQIIKRTESHDL